MELPRRVLSFLKTIGASDWPERLIPVSLEHMTFDHIIGGHASRRILAEQPLRRRGHGRLGRAETGALVHGESLGTMEHCASHRPPAWRSLRLGKRDACAPLFFGKNRGGNDTHCCVFPPNFLGVSGIALRKISAVGFESVPKGIATDPTRSCSGIRCHGGGESCSFSHGQADGHDPNAALDGFFAGNGPSSDKDI